MTKKSTGSIKENLGANANKIVYFVKWFVDSSDKTKESFDKIVKPMAGCEFEYAMTEWILKEDVQLAIKEYLKIQRSIKMLSIYESMYKKATNGDVNSAKWVETFFKSDFFESESDEADQYLEGIDIPALKNKKGDK